MTRHARYGRRGRGLAAAMMVGGMTVGGLAMGCEGLRGGDTSPAEGTESSPGPAVQAAPKSSEPPPAAAAPSLLAGVLDHAIEPPPEGGSTYRVDAYLGALVVEQLGREPLPFTAWRPEQPDPSRPEAGYRVGPLAADALWTRLGLREGDIVTALNGVPSTDPGWVAQALQRGENRVTVTVFRDEVSFVLSYRLMGGMAWAAAREQLAPSSTVVAEVSPEPLGGAELLEPGDDPSSAPAGSASRGGGASPGKSRPSRPASSPSVPSRPASGGGSSGSAAVAQCSSAARCTLQKSYFDGIVRSPSKLESQANIVPAIRNDVHSGYRLASVRSGSAVAQLGFRSGDKITHINGRDLTNDLEAMQLYMGLSGTRRFTVRFVRGASARTKVIDVV